MTCPKCGFLQPPDQFCANCGVNMAKFSARRRHSFASRILRNYVFQATVIIAIVGLTSFLIYQKKRAEVQRMQASLERQQSELNQIYSSTSDLNADVKPEPVAKGPTRKNHETALQVNSAKMKNSGVVDGVNALGVAPLSGKQAQKRRANTGGTAAGSELPGLKVQFTDLSSAFEQSIKQVAEQFAGQPQIYRVRDLQNVFTRAQQAASVLVLKSKQSEAGSRNLLVNQTTIDRYGRQVGLRLQVQPKQTAGELSLHIQFWRALDNVTASGSTSVQALRFDRVVGLRKKDGVIIVGTLPRRPLRLDEQALFANSVLWIMHDPNFQNGASDFAIFITVPSESQ